MHVCALFAHTNSRMFTLQGTMSTLIRCIACKHTPLNLEIETYKQRERERGRAWFLAAV